MYVLRALRHRFNVIFRREMIEMENTAHEISVLGSTGSVGEQALDVAAAANMRVRCISANRNSARVEEQARRFGVRAVAMAEEKAAADLRSRLADTSVKVYAGESGICEMISECGKHTVVNSIIGEAGLLPTLAVIDAEHRLALANKESLVVAGELVMSRAREKGVEVLPVDSEHSAIFQCLKSGKQEEIKSIILTASGGPFFGRRRDELGSITRADALAHPTWKMGAKITVDSATLMNKGFEVIEAVHLFGVTPEQVRVAVHRQSIIHSMVEYIDNSIIAQLSVPDMRLCVEYAVSYPHREAGVVPALDIFSLSGLTFEHPDTEAFPLLAEAYSCIARGGASPAVLNAANEVAVAKFLRDEISFLRISEAVCETVDRCSSAADAHTLEEILECDRAARVTAEEILK